MTVGRSVVLSFGIGISRETSTPSWAFPTSPSQDRHNQLVLLVSFWFRKILFTPHHHPTPPTLHTLSVHTWWSNENLVTEEGGRPCRRSDQIRLIVFIELLPVPKHSHCALVACNYEWETVALHSAFEYPPKWCTYRAIWTLCGWCHEKLLPSLLTLCADHASMHQFTVLLKATCLGCMHV